MKLIPNPSFEEGGTDGPNGWSYSGPSSRLMECWPSDLAHDGSRCIRFNARTDYLSWTSDRVPIMDGDNLILEWWTQMSGGEPWHWS
jgi:hypothetical protein